MYGSLGFVSEGLQTICTVPLPVCACGQVLQSWNYNCCYSLLCKMGCLDSDGCEHLMNISSPEHRSLPREDWGGEGSVGEELWQHRESWNGGTGVVGNFP